MKSHETKINKLKDASNWEVWKFQIKVIMSAAEVLM